MNAKHIKYFIITLWITFTSILYSVAANRWQGADDLILWLQQKNELNCTEYLESGSAADALLKQENIDSRRYDSTVKLINTLAFRYFSRLREAKDLSGVSEMFEATSVSELKLQILAALGDGKDDEFSARVIYHALDRKNWFPRRGWDYAYDKARARLFDQLLGNTVTSEGFNNLDHPESQQILKQALETRWPIILKESTKIHNREPLNNSDSPDFSFDSRLPEDGLVHLGNTDGKRKSPRWQITILSLLIMTLIVILIKNRYGMSGK